MTRDRARELVIQAGGSWVPNVTKKVNVVVSHIDDSKKLQIAEKYNIPIWNESQFLDVLKKSGIDPVGNKKEGSTGTIENNKSRSRSKSPVKKMIETSKSPNKNKRSTSPGKKTNSKSPVRKSPGRKPKSKSPVRKSPARKPNSKSPVRKSPARKERSKSPTKYEKHCGPDACANTLNYLYYAAMQLSFCKTKNCKCCKEASEHIKKAQEALMICCDVHTIPPLHLQSPKASSSPNIKTRGRPKKS
jgi:hypothetical protein